MAKCNKPIQYRHLNEDKHDHYVGAARGRATSKGPALVAALLAAATLAVAGTVILILLRLPADAQLPIIFQRSADRATVYAQMQKYNSHSNLPYSPSTENTDHNEKEKVVSCYYNTPQRHAEHQLLPADLHPFLCTHINIAFARVVDKMITLDESQYKTIMEIVQLKKINPKLKILVSVGGAGDDSGFSEMVADHASRKVFIRSIKSLLRNYTLDGVDLDWEFPALHGVGDRLQKRERQHFSQLLHEIRAEYVREKRNYLLTVAVAAPETIVDISYDVDQLDLYVDYVNVMSYDYHYYTKYTPFTGLNAPLYGRPSDQMYLATLNINYTVHMYIDKGLARDKIVVGIPTYGHSFTLVNSLNARVGSPASGYGSMGGLGFVNYPEVCTFIRNHDSEVTIQHDEYAKVPYLYRDHEWVSYDTPESVLRKAEYVKEQGLRGAMVYSLNADDFAGECGARGAPSPGPGPGPRFPLVQSVTAVLLHNASSAVAGER